ncbi:glycosyltransferase family 10 [Synechococcus sp. A15-24]|uniref:glycosyltransferase family 10 domain-containing protein n=1 Tax=Synechococcus sp. A15-24 TaxID=1050635 RepID=UPI00164740C3|nr:glycosyltransferase family 10 [Synechococcus sp. A15-24]QNJ27808.1 glycosyltransferase 10 family protein [Synechococcus sp. A15-24]
MFQRQWHSPGSQIGLEDHSIKHEYSLIKHDYRNAISNIDKYCNSSQNKYWTRQKSRLKHILSRKTDCINISFEGFWPDFNCIDNQILDFIRLAVIDKNLQINIIPSSPDTDINFSSCYGQYLVLPSNATQILFLGENVRPNFLNFDYSAGFDQFTSCNRIIYMPLWLFEIDLFNKSYDDRNPLQKKIFHSEQSVDFSKRKDAVAFIGNNAEPFREYFLNQLIDFGFQVDRFGSHTNPVGNKFDLLKNYKYSLCFENSFHPGYVTEKLPHSLISGCISLYFGCLTNEPFANHPLIFNVSSSMDIRKSMLEIKEFGSKFFDIYSSPSIASKNQINNLCFKIVDSLRSILQIYS